MKDKYSNLLIFLSFIIFIGLAYSNTLDSPFVFDDQSNIVDNYAIKLRDLSLHRIANIAFCGNRAIPMLSFAMNYYFHGLQVTGYHVINILIHICTAIAIFIFIELTLTHFFEKKNTVPNKAIAFFTTIIWALHPVQTQSVTYIVQRMNSLCALFYILSLIFYVKGRITEKQNKRNRFYLLAVICGMLSIGSKENAAMLPFMIFFYEWIFFQKGNIQFLKKNLKWIVGLILLGFIFTFIYLGKSPYSWIVENNAVYNMTPWERMMTEFRIIMYYISLLVFPHPSRLNIDYDFTISHSLFDPLSTFFSLLILLFLIITALYYANKNKILAYSILWFLGNLAIESTVIGIDLVFEHRLYLPSIFFFLLIVFSFSRFIKYKQLLFIILALISSISLFWTYERNIVWADEVVLWQDCVAKAPNRARIHNSLGLALSKKGQYKQAILSYKNALRIRPDYAWALSNLGLALFQINKTEEAIAVLKKAIKTSPNLEEAQTNLGMVLLKTGQIKKALPYFKKAHQIRPKMPEMNYNLGAALSASGLHNEAIHYFRQAIYLDPYYANAHNSLALSLVKLNDFKSAALHYNAAIFSNPNFANAYNNYGILLARSGRLDQAKTYFLKALQLDPQLESARFNLKKTQMLNSHQK